MCGIPATWKIDFRVRLSKVLVMFALSCLARRLGFQFRDEKMALTPPWRLPPSPFDACPPLRDLSQEGRPAFD